MARQNIDAFLDADVDAVVVNAAGCGAAMKEYDHLLRDDPIYAEKAKRFSSIVKDAAQFLGDLGLVGKLAPLKMTVTYQDPCHLAHGQRIRSQPRNLLKSIPGLQFKEMDGSDRCCGSAGIYNITHPEMSQHLLKEKMQSVAATQAEAVIAPNPGCMLQLRYGSQQYGPEVKVYHLMDLLDRAYSEAESSSSNAGLAAIDWRNRSKASLALMPSPASRLCLQPITSMEESRRCYVFQPSPEQVAAALRLCSEANATVAPWGGGTAMAIGNQTRQVDIVIGLERLNLLVEHDQANLTATVQSGHRLAALQEVLARHNQFLPFDPPAPARATVGGVVATNLNGPDEVITAACAT